MDCADRPRRVAERLGDLDALVVSDLTNLRWLVGFTGSAGVVVLGRDGAVTVIVDGRYGDQASRQTRAAGVDATVLVGATADEQVQHLARAVDGGRVGFEAAQVTYAVHQRWTSALTADLVATHGVVEAERRRKSPDEVALIAEAARIADVALGESLDLLRPGVTEVAVRNRLEERMRAHGASGPSYETIVAAGPEHAALPHHRPTDSPLSDGDTVVIDVGALFQGFHSDMTRTFMIGRPTDEQVTWYELVARAQRAGLAAVASGVPARQVDAACRAVFAEAGVAEYFIHGTGHGVGLLIHEDPYLNRASDDVLADGDVVTVEPGLYRVGLGGVRIEDLVVVTGDGHRNLTSSPKDLLCLPSPPTT